MSDNKPKRFPWTFKVGADNKPTVLTVIRKGVATTIQAGSKFFKEIYNGLVTGDHQKVDNYVNLKQAIAEFSNGAFKMYDNCLTYKGQEIHNAAADRVLELYRLGKDSLPIVNFLERILRNPSQDAQRELFLFLEHNDLPITEDGFFLAYKMVRHDFKDKYTGKMDNSPGAVVKLDRNHVDPYRDNTCSHGLHFCSLEYVEKGNYGVTHSDKLVVLKIDPQHVVTIPSDYNNSKGRACEYTILREMEWTERLKKWTAKEDEAVYTPSGEPEDDDSDEGGPEMCEECGEVGEYCRCDDEDNCHECGEMIDNCVCDEEEEEEQEEEPEETPPVPVATPVPAPKLKPGESKLTDGDLASIDKLLAMKNRDGSQVHTYTHIGKMYNVHRSTIQRYHAKKKAKKGKRKR